MQHGAATSCCTPFFQAGMSWYQVPGRSNQFQSCLFAKVLQRFPTFRSEAVPIHHLPMCSGILRREPTNPGLVGQVWNSAVQGQKAHTVNSIGPHGFGWFSGSVPLQWLTNGSNGFNGWQTMTNRFQQQTLSTYLCTNSWTDLGCPWLPRLPFASFSLSGLIFCGLFTIVHNHSSLHHFPQAKPSWHMLTASSSLSSWARSHSREPSPPNSSICQMSQHWRPTDQLFS